MTSSKRIARSGRVQVVVSAPVDAVWRVVSDVTRTGEWSHECRDVAWLDGASSAAPGVRFRGGNRLGIWRWTRRCELLVVEPPRRLSWRTVPTVLFPDSTDWRFELEPAGGGTRISQEFEVTKTPAWWAWLMARLAPPHRDRSVALAGDLRRLGDVAATEERIAGKRAP